MATVWTMLTIALKIMKALLIMYAIALLGFINSSVAAQKASIIKSRPATDSRTVKPRSRYLRTNKIRIHYLEWNEGGDPTVLLLHGLYDSADTWSTVGPMLAKNYRVIALDRRGSGSTDKPASGYDFQTLAEDVLEFTGSLKLRPVHLIGHSAGAGVVLTIAATKPEQVESIVLVDGGFWTKHKTSSDTLPVAPCTAKPVVCRRIAAIEHGSMNYDPEPLYGHVSIPTLLIMGIPSKSEAEQFPNELREAQSHVNQVATEKLKNGNFAIVAETGHWIHRDRPEEFVKLIGSFIEKTINQSERKESFHFGGTIKFSRPKPF